MKRRFAVKFLRPDFSRRREILERFQREAETAGALESENVTATIDFGITTDGSPYIVMEYLVGESLAALLAREHSLPVGRAADLCVQACRGVQAAHAAGIVHRDLKPQNLFVCRREDGTDLVKVLDFGIAKLKAVDSQGAVTCTGELLGTPFYMSPEQARGDHDTDHRVDVYGLGAVLYQLLSGQRPHLGDSHNAILHHIATQPALPLAAQAAALPVSLVEIVHRSLASDPRARFASAKALAEALAPFARRAVWPAASNQAVPVNQGVPSAMAASKSPGAMASSRRSVGKLVALGTLLVGAALALGAFFVHRATGPSPRAGRHSMPPSTQFFAPYPAPGAIRQIASLGKSKDSLRERGLLTSMTSTPQGVWFTGGSPDEVQSTARNTMVRAARAQRVPVLVAYNLTYRDCAGYGAGGTADGAAYRAWIDGFARGIGNEKAVVILEPDSLGIIPHNTTILGEPEWCKPTVTDARGNTVSAPGATPAERYAQLNYAVDSLASKAPNALVYLDGTHSAWLPVGEIAYRLTKAGVQKVQGFATNVASFQRTPEATQYGTWISKCIYYANNPANGRLSIAHYAACDSPQRHVSPDRDRAWSLTEKWYVDNVDNAANPPAGPAQLAHFVIDTSRNGRGVLDTAPYASAPYHQPKDVLDKLNAGSWCNPPGAGLGLRPSTDTGAPLVDAFLWVKRPGESDGSCDIAGGVRAWDYSKYSFSGIAGEALGHFDPLWGMVDPIPGEWFPEQALQLAQNASPPLSP